MLRSAALAFAVSLVAANGASGEVVARGVEQGVLALGPKGAPTVAFVHGSKLVVASRSAKGKWTRATAATIVPGSTVAAFRVGSAGPVALVEGKDTRSLVLVRRHSVGWQTIPLAGKLPRAIRLGAPGLALDGHGRPWVGYTRWDALSLNSQLLLATIDDRGKITSKPITADGFPQSLVPPPAAAVFVGGRVHVIESYGYRDVLTTLEWFPTGRTWLGLGLDAGLGDFPVGQVYAGLSPSGVLHAAWTAELTFFGSTPVTLVTRKKLASSKFILDRALTTGLALPSTGPEVAANEWDGPQDYAQPRNQFLWAGTIVHGDSRIELDGWLAGLAVPPRGGRDVLLGGPDGLRWFHSPRRLTTKVTLGSVDDGSGAIALSGRVRGVASGKVTIYRERPGESRKAIGTPALAGGAFSFTDHPTGAPAMYRAVYVDPKTRIPFAALTRDDADEG